MSKTDWGHESTFGRIELRIKYAEIENLPKILFARNSIDNLH